jgi:heptaprenyl diphosphate synthase
MNRWENFRQKRNETYRRLFLSTDLCVAALIAMPAFLFNSSTSARIVQFLLFLLCVWLAGKKNNLVITFIIMMGIILFNLIVPYGEELFCLGKFRVTEGALWGGIHRAVTLEGLIMLSRVCIRPDLKLPGTFGALMAESFRMLEKIKEHQRIISRKNIIGGIDQLMMELSADDENLPAENSIKKQKRSALGIIILIIICAVIWLIMLLPIVFSHFFGYAIILS